MPLLKNLFDNEDKMADCLFCKIINHEIPSDIVYEDEDTVIFTDINPTTPVHLLVVPRRHIVSLQDMTQEDIVLAGKMIQAANHVAREKGIAGAGYRLVINSGPEAGQEIPHLHMHILGGRKLDWKH